MAVLCRGLEKNGMVRAWHGRGMASVNQTRPHCVNQMGKTHSKPLAARHGRGTAWARHAMCESALSVLRLVTLALSSVSSTLLKTLCGELKGMGPILKTRVGQPIQADFWVQP